MTAVNWIYPEFKVYHRRISFLHRIPGIVNKLKKSEHHGPTGSAQEFKQSVSGSAWLGVVAAEA